MTANAPATHSSEELSAAFHATATALRTERQGRAVASK
jgi:hypothetical protein